MATGTYKKNPGRKQRLGSLGEERVAQYLISRGEEILERNWRVREGSDL